MNQTVEPAAVEPISIPVEGMTCASCVRRVETAAARVPGVAASSVNFATKKLTVEPGEGFSPEALVAAIGKIGYEVPQGAMQRALKDAGYMMPVADTHDSPSSALPGTFSPPAGRRTDTAPSRSDDPRVRGSSTDASHDHGDDHAHHGHSGPDTADRKSTRLNSSHYCAPRM